MAIIETDPEITALIYDANGGTHIGDLSLFEEPVEIERANPEETVVTEDVTDRLALRALHGYRKWDKLPRRISRLSD